MTSSRSVAFSRSFSGSFTQTGRVLRTQLWIWPLVAAFALGIIGWWVRGTIEHALKDNLASELQTILNADLAALDLWFRAQEANADTLAGDERVRDMVLKLDSTTPQTQVDLRTHMNPLLKRLGYIGFVIVDKDFKIVASGRDENLNTKIHSIEDQVKRAFSGEPTLTHPYKSQVLLTDEDGQMRMGVPTMFTLAPIRDQMGAVMAVLGLRLRPEIDFSRILSVARPGQSGDTYAFDKAGVFLSQSRFDDQLKQVGLLADRDSERSILNLEVRDPQADLTQGDRPKVRHADQALTRMAADAVAGKAGVDVEGYRDYRGVTVVGAWKWLPDYGIGVATEVGTEEAFGPLRILRIVFWGLFSLLAIGAVAIFAFMLVNSRMQRALRRAVIEAKTLGQYTLAGKIGAGGMGMVYKATHAMLRRPTAIKLLDADKITPETIARFEREVQLTSQLNHPNTIAVYDFGHTPEGVFYYAMEFLDGLTLDAFVTSFGAQPEGRVIFILKQICGSLTEAHSTGLIHRDIKPGNIMLTRRGGITDFVKVLDFGLVKALDTQHQVALTAGETVAGTPQYMSPEGFERPQEVDARSDIYAVGAVGYFLLTGMPVFKGKTLIEVCMQQVSEIPQRPSERLGRPVSSDLEEILLRCLAKKKDDRPASTKELMNQLSRCMAAPTWTSDDADDWWRDVYPLGKTVPVTAPTLGQSGETLAFDSKMAAGRG